MSAPVNRIMEFKKFLKERRSSPFPSQEDYIDCLDLDLDYFEAFNDEEFRSSEPCDPFADMKALKEKQRVACCQSQLKR
eukprot:scaffold105204_cov27-Prasinocladus_malaysianus.AAC.1